MLETILFVILLLIVGVPIFINIIGPFIVWKTQKVPAIVKFQALEDDEFLANRNEKFKEYDQSLLRLGFFSVGSSLLKDSNTDSHFRLYWHNGIRVAAMVVTMQSKVEENTSLEITQKYTDGSFLGVSNSKTPEAYPKLDIKLSYRFPKIINSDELLKVHTRLKARYKSDLEPLDYDVSKGFHDVELFFKKESDALFDIGVVKKEIDTEGKRSLTLQGAMALTYRSIPPGKNIWAYITEKRAEAALKNA
ncbi:MAG: hypothetical protein DRQ48_07375 [Gammaproteobacteria bacterium]|nr:MAG: hypothetical protein DRQ58_09980 [Gammaproteobacteria bacterium]RKZ69805.1 MAG: hypothetical protein DRQ48_07375 [Gammaproteobacteria bacterium]